MRHSSTIYFEIVAELYDNTIVLFQSNELHRPTTTSRGTIIRPEPRQNSMGNVDLEYIMCPYENSSVLSRINYNMSKLELDRVALRLL